MLVDAFSGWPEAIWVKDHSTATVMVLRIIFSRHGVPHTLVGNNATEFCDVGLVKWLQHVGCFAMKTLPMHPQLDGLAECMVQMLKKTASMWDSFILSLLVFLLNYRCIPHLGKSQSLSQLMGCQIQNPLTFKNPIHAPIWFAPTAKAPTEEATYLAQKGNNIAYILRQNGNVSLAHEEKMHS